MELSPAIRLPELRSAWSGLLYTRRFADELFLLGHHPESLPNNNSGCVPCVEMRVGRFLQFRATHCIMDRSTHLKARPSIFRGGPQGI